MVYIAHKFVLCSCTVHNNRPCYPIITEAIVGSDDKSFYILFCFDGESCNAFFVAIWILDYIYIIMRIWCQAVHNVLVPWFLCSFDWPVLFFDPHVVTVIPLGIHVGVCNGPYCNAVLGDTEIRFDIVLVAIISWLGFIVRAIIISLCRLASPNHSWEESPYRRHTVAVNWLDAAGNHT